jgi:hypothetical protein
MFGKYALYDFKNKYYWKKNRHWGYNFQNQEIQAASFTDDIREATLITWQEVAELIQRFQDGLIIMDGLLKADVESLGRLGIKFISEEDAKYLKGEPAPLVITVPGIKIDE